VNYSADVARIRAERHRAVDQPRADADPAAAIAELRAARDAEIRRLSRDGMSPRSIAAAVGCSVTMVYEIRNPSAREAYNARRRAYWRERRVRQSASSGKATA